MKIPGTEEESQPASTKIVAIANPPQVIQPGLSSTTASSAKTNQNLIPGAESVQAGEKIAGCHFASKINLPLNTVLY